MIIVLKMPKLSPTMEAGTIVKWHKKAGDSIKLGDIILEVSTDKAVVEHTASEDGWIREILSQEGSKINIGKPIAIISGDQNEQYDLDKLLPKNQETTEANNKTTLKKETKEEPSSNINTSFSLPIFKPEPPLSQPINLKTPFSPSLASPLAKKIAKEQNLDISNIQGSGPGGRIIEKDLQFATKKSIAGFGYPEGTDILPGSYTEKPLSPIREVIASRLQAAKITVPEFYIKQQVYVSPLLKLSQELLDQGIKLSINDFIIRACAIALRDHPIMNSGFNGENNHIIQFNTIDIAIAVAINDGIITPIIRCADKKNLGMISTEVKELVSKAKQNTLMEHEYKGGSFCISNLGMTGISEFCAIINPPQSAILAVGGIQEQPIVKDNQITIGSTMNLTLTVDHRVIDGYPAALFIKKVQKILEAPSILLLN